MEEDYQEILISIFHLKRSISMNRIPKGVWCCWNSNKAISNLRSMKLERIRLLQEIDALLGRGRRFLQEEAPEMFPPAEVTRLLDDMFPASKEELENQDPSI